MRVDLEEIEMTPVLQSAAPVNPAECSAKAKPLQPLKLGMIGLNFGGYIAETLAGNAAEELFQLVAVCDQDAARADEFGRRNGVKAYHSLDALLADEEIPVVALFTSPSGRADLLRRIIRAGKDVMTTKPFELDAREARSVLEEAQSLGRVIHLNSPPPEIPAYLRQIKQWQKDYDLGQPVHCRGEMLVSYREKADGRWLDDPALCPAGPIFRLGIYVMNDLVRLFGRVDEVQVMTSRLFTGRPTPDNAQLSLRFGNGALGAIYATFCVDNGQHYASSLILHYERGTIYRNVLPVGYAKAEGSSRLLLMATEGRREVLVKELELPEICGSYQWEVFHRAVMERRPLADFEDVVHSIGIVEAVVRSEQTGGTEPVLPTAA